MDGLNLLDSQIFSEFDIYALRQKVWSKLNISVFTCYNLLEHEVANMVFNTTLQVLNDSLKEKGITLTKEGGDKDG